MQKIERALCEAIFVEKIFNRVDITIDRAV